MALRILVVEDDADINYLVAQLLRQGGYEADQAYSGTEARLLLAGGEYALLVMDLMMPGLTGEELIPLVREVSGAPIIVLSARESPQDKAMVLRLGADDYMTKPFDGEELLARVEACLRRAAGSGAASPGGILSFRDLRMDRENHSLTVGGEPASLTAREFAILELLLSNPRKVFTKANIYRSVWNDEFFGDDNTVNVHISNLRSKLGPEDYIQTVWGIGFKMKDGEG